ncbi:MAG: hypothetical protein R3D03_04555 [Geminicoccaceae bacterium]
METGPDIRYRRSTVLIAAGLFFCINLDDGIGIHDRVLSQLLAAAMLESGRRGHLRGRIYRGLLFTYIVSWVTGLLGDNLGVAELPSAISMKADLHGAVHLGPPGRRTGCMVFRRPLHRLALCRDRGPEEYVNCPADAGVHDVLLAGLREPCSRASPARRMLLAALSLPFLAGRQPPAHHLLGLAPGHAHAWVAGAILPCHS